MRPLAHPWFNDTLLTIASRLRCRETTELAGIPNPKVPGSRPGRPTGGTKGSALFSRSEHNGVARKNCTNANFPAPMSRRVAPEDARSELDQMASHLTGVL